MTRGSNRPIEVVGVVGLGTMGAGIAEVLARNGLEVIAVEADESRLATGRGHVERSTSRAVARGKLSEADQQALLGRIRFTSAPEDLAAAHLVIEAVPEKLDLKREIFGKLDSICSPETVLATNTSSLSVTEISVATHDPSRVVGMHFFNPAPVQKFVEIVRTVVTEPDVVDAVVDLARRLGKQPVVVGDKAGFIANALLFGYLNHAVQMYEQRYATREDLDAAMTLGCGLPMGPLALMDLIGLDTASEILDTMYKQGRDRLHAPAPLLKQLVAAGLLGRKTGRGFYTYAEPGSSKVVPDPPGGRGPAGSRTGGPAARGAHRRRRGFRDAGDRIGRGVRRRPGTRWCSSRTARRGRGLEDSRGRRPRGRGRRRGARRQEGALREPRRDLPAGRRARDDDVVAAGHRVRGGDLAARRRRRPALSSTRCRR